MCQHTSIYGGALQELIERDSLASDADYSLNDINSKIDDLVSEITSLRADIDEITDLFGSQQKEIADYCAEIGERLSDIEMSIFDMTENT